MHIVTVIMPIIRLLCVLTLVCSAIHSEETPAITADAYLQQARDLMVKGQATLSGKDSEKLGRAIAAIDVLLAKVGAGATEEKLDPKLMKSIIGAKFALKGAANDEITLSYANWEPNGLLDWTPAGVAPMVVKGVMAIEPGSSLAHKLQFGNAVQISGEVSCGNKEGDHLQSTSGLQVNVSSYNAWLVNGMINGKKMGSAVFDKSYTETDGSSTWNPFTIKLEKKSISLTWTGQKMAGEMGVGFGSLVLQGGNGGNRFRNLVIIGTLDHEWVKKAIEIKSIDEAVKKK